MSEKIEILITGTDQASKPLDDVSKGLAGLESSAKQASGGLSTFKVALGAATGMLAAEAAKALVTLAKNALGTGLNFNAMSEQAQIAFSTMLGSGREAEKFLHDLQAFAAKTPFEFPELVQAAQKMLAFGFESGKVLPMLRAVGDSVAALGGSSAQVDRVTTALGQMQAKQKVSAEEMLQLTEAGIPAWDILAKKIGVSVPEAMKMAEKGGISAATAIDALVAGMTQRFGGMMDQQSKSWKGYLSTIRDTFAQLAGKVMTPLFDYLKSWMPWLIERMDGLIIAWDMFMGLLDSGLSTGAAMKVVMREMLPDSVMETLEWVIDLFDELWTDAVKPFVGYVQNNVMPIFGRLGNTIRQFGGEALREIWAFVTGNETHFVAVQRLWQGLIDAGHQVGELVGRAFSGLVNTIRDQLPDWVEQIGKWGAEAWVWLATVAVPKVREQIRVWWETLRDSVTSNWPAWKDKLKLWATSAWDWLTTEAIPMARAKITEWWIMLRDYVSTNWPIWKAKMQEWGDAVWQEFAERFPDAAAKVTEGMDKLKTEWGPWVDYFLNKDGELKEDWDELKRTWDDFVQDVKDTIKPITPYIDEFKEAWDNLKSAIDNLKQVWTNVFGYFSRAWDEMFGEGGTSTQLKSWGQIVGQVINLSVEFITVNLIGAVKLLTAAVQLLSGDWKGAWESIKSAATDVGTFVVGIVNTMIDVIDKLTGGALTDMIQAGKDMIQGLWDGMQQKWDKFKDWWNRQIAFLPDALEEYLEMGSPSKLFERYGKWMMEGLQIGIDNAGDAVISSLTDIANATRLTMDDALTAIKTTMDQGSKAAKDYAASLQPFLGQIQHAALPSTKFADSLKEIQAGLKAGEALYTAENVGRALSGTGVSSDLRDMVAEQLAKVLDITGIGDIVQQKLSPILEALGSSNVIQQAEGLKQISEWLDQARRQADAAMPEPIRPVETDILAGKTISQILDMAQGKAKLGDIFGLDMLSSFKTGLQSIYNAFWKNAFGQRTITEDIYNPITGAVIGSRLATSGDTIADRIGLLSSQLRTSTSQTSGSDILPLLRELIQLLLQKGVGNQFSVQMLSAGSGSGATDVANMVAYLNALYG